jgi:NAD(P)H dehydrogenase (quinone)
MPEVHPVLVTGATGDIGGRVVSGLRAHEVPVRALVHHEDDRARALRAMSGVQVVVGDLTVAPDVVAALNGCRRIYLGMSVSPYYLEAAVTVAVAALDNGSVELLVNMSQMTVSQMDLSSTTESRQQRLHWLAEHILNWSGLPVTHIRPTVFMENPLFSVLAVASIRRNGTIRLPFGNARTSPVAARDVADVVVRVLADPSRHASHVCELTGAASRDMAAIAAEFSAALSRPVTYVDVPYEDWLEHDLKPLGLAPHLQDHIATIARLHRDNRYDRATTDIADLLGRPPSGFDSVINEIPALQRASLSDPARPTAGGSRIDPRGGRESRGVGSRIDLEKWRVIRASTPGERPQLATF